MVAEEHKEGYKTAFKATALFGGVQIFTILISLAKNKLVAMWLGSTGMGIMSLFSRAIELISMTTNLGLQSSAVRDIANADSKGDHVLLSRIVRAINRWVLTTGLLGALLTIALSPLLSRIIFDSGAYTISFVMLSCVVLMMGIYGGNNALLQGVRRFRYMAKANIFGALAGFVCSVPIFYFFRERGIVPAMIVTSLATLVVTFLYAGKVKLARADQTWKESYRLGLKTMKLGVMMALSGVAAGLVSNAVNVFIRYVGGEDGEGQVGLYAAGVAINVSYLGLVFTAMSKDYFPRLSQISSDNIAVKRAMNQQAEIAILIIAPLIIGMIIFLPLVIRLLYTEEFLGVVEMTRWMLLGSLFKACSWAIGYVFLAKGDGKTYLFNELIIYATMLVLYMSGYRLFGLTGLGYAFVASYVIYTVQVCVLCRCKYSISYGKEFWTIFAILLTVCLAYLILELYLNNRILKYIAAGAAMTFVCGYSFYGLNRRFGLINYFTKR